MAKPKKPESVGKRMIPASIARIAAELLVLRSDLTARFPDLSRRASALERGCAAIGLIP